LSFALRANAAQHFLPPILHPHIEPPSREDDFEPFAHPIGVQKWRRDSFRAAKKPVSDRKNDLKIRGVGGKLLGLLASAQARNTWETSDYHLNPNGEMMLPFGLLLGAKSAG